MDAVWKFIEANGMPGACLISALGVAYWLAQNVAKPLVAAHLDYLASSQKRQAETVDWLECHADSLKTMAKVDAENSKTFERMARNYERLARA